MTYKDITSYELACQINKQDPNNLPDVSKLDPAEGEDVINSLKLKRIIRALNTDQETGKVWEPNWSDKNQRKYTPWVEVKASAEQPGGFAFSYSYFDYWCAFACSGSRLCLESSDRVMHLYEHFNDLMVKCYLIIK